MATLEDIARTLGVSKGTVSKALSGAGGVSDAMRKSVVETAVELGYSRICRKDASRRIAVFITNMDYAKPEDFGYDILAGFRKLAEPDGYQVVVVPLSCALENSVPYDAYMMQHNYLGGLFLGLSLNDPWLEDFKTCKTPAVLYDNCVSGNPRVTSLSVDNAEAMDQTVRYLKDLGHKKIGYLSPELGSYVYQKRYQAFFRALEENSLPHDEGLGKRDFYTSVCLSEHLPALLAEGCTAIVCGHDLLASSVLIQCMNLGVRIPEELSIVGFDDLPLCQLTLPPLTTIRQNRTELGKSAYFALSSQLHDVSISLIQLHTELIARFSCGKAPEAPLSKERISKIKSVTKKETNHEPENLRRTEAAIRK